MPKATRSAEAEWSGSLSEGSGSVRRPDADRASEPLSWRARVGDSQQTSPEELIAAAHAGCLSMALSNVLSKQGAPPERLNVSARCSLDYAQDPARISEVELDVAGRVDGMDAERFAELVRQAEAACPVSNALRNNVEVRVRSQLD